MFIYHSLKHEFSFRSDDCSSQLISLILIPRFLLHIKNEVIGFTLDPLVEEKLHKELHEELNDVNFMSVLSDISSRKLINSKSGLLFSIQFTESK